MSEVKEDNETIPFYPDHVSTEARVALFILVAAVIIGVLGLIWPVGVGQPADPMDTPAHTKPEWYFLFLYEILKYVPKTVGALIPFVGVALILLWPFIDKRKDSQSARRTRIVASVVIMLIIVALTLIGYYS
ncbi:MAG: hypothetical protein GTO18_01850 [Anaerolineales bacterium]|nr:hypothetical protein [Anaerolineales bacterium]